ncbi:efflux transporter outer membrane subunit [Rugamonas sp.]|uniref:efflux transporter outer membrane subunit n=1 Tax=Rugamonas sp. TaxID=1926287 RepID=UPI0025F9BC90|nr:efflux transporter outer membrane subunit [Rugamonas sp.]
MKSASSLTVLLLSGGLAACSLAPEYKKPETVAAPQSYKEIDGWKPAQPSEEQARGKWWQAYGDAELNAMEEHIGAGNQSLQAAVARLQQARAQTRQVSSDLAPTVTTNPSATRGRTSTNSPRYPNGAEPTLNNFNIGLDVSYELDVFGRVRNAVSTAKAGQQASAADLATLDLSLHAELANDYFSLRSDDAQQLLLDHTVDDYEKSLKLTENLFNGGGTALIDVAQAQAQLETARTRAADIRLHRAQTEHAIAVLLGRNPSEFHLDAKPLAVTQAPPAIATGLPSALLERRPDVAGAERRVAAANAEIGVARAAYFPVFSLAGLFGYDSAQSSSWLKAPSRTWSFGPTAVLTLFDGGRRRALNEQAQAVYDEKVANYRGTVLTAYQEVEDNIAALVQLEKESNSQALAVKASGTALEQANYRYKGGLVTYLEVSTIENVALQAQLSAAAIQLRRMQASVLLVKALGGGWQATDDSGEAVAAK